MHGLVVILDSRTGMALGHHVADNRVGRHADADRIISAAKPNFSLVEVSMAKILSKPTIGEEPERPSLLVFCWFDLFCLLKRGCQSAIAFFFLVDISTPTPPTTSRAPIALNSRGAETTGGGQVEALAVDDILR